ncbi:MAG: glycosyltransferase family 8 protein [Bacteroidales bacterium]|nr:glycosyltransferase family 8 protein [Bacteroidales bacterium]
MKSLIPIFFSVNDAYAPYLAVALTSMKENASKEYNYHIHILNDDICESNREMLSRLNGDGFELEFISLSEKLRKIDPEGKLNEHCFGAFSSLTIYFRLFIPSLFPQYDKGIYLDSDILVPGDISELYMQPMGDKLIGAVADYSIQHITPFMRYIDMYDGVDHRNYINSGVLLLNMKRLREVDIEKKFLYLMKKYGLRTVAPDQDYLNVLCWGQIHYLDPNWDAMPSEMRSSFDNPHIIHFNLSSKPWLNERVPYSDLFWHYARRSGFYRHIRRNWRAYTRNAEAMEKYSSDINGLISLAAELCDARVSFRSLAARSQNRVRLCC